MILGFQVTLTTGICAITLLTPLVHACGQPQHQKPAEGRSSAPTTGLDAGTMSRTVARASQLPRLRALLVLRDGETLAAHRFNGGPSLDRPVNIKSASKSVLSALVGIAIERQTLRGVDQPVLSVLGVEAPTSRDP